MKIALRPQVSLIATVNQYLPVYLCPAAEQGAFSDLSLAK